ncbi:MAG: DUF134 domain-containing protein [Halobacteriota archaeon]
MPRRKKCRWIYTDVPPEVSPAKGGAVELFADELEAIRLTDVEQMSQSEAAHLMGISQPTLHRVLKEGRKKLGIAVLENREVIVAGGEHTMRRLKCFDCGHEWSEPYGTGRPACPHCKSVNAARVGSKEKERRGRRRGKGPAGRRRRGEGQG